MLPCLWGKANFNPKNWVKSPSLGSHPRLKGNQILRVAHVVLVWEHGDLNCEMYGGLSFFQDCTTIPLDKSRIKPIAN